jgi:hypothetical protein
MPSVHLDPQVPAAKVFDAVEKMSLVELEQLLSRVLAVQAKRKAPYLSARESELLIQINRGLPSDTKTRLDELTAKRRAETLTPEEHNELLRLLDQLEALTAKRTEAIAELARMRGVSMTALMRTLGIAPKYAEASRTGKIKAASRRARQRMLRVLSES